MKQNTTSRPGVALLIIGLMLTAVLPSISRHFHAPDFVSGFLTGLGLAVEVIALAMLQRNKRNNSVC